MAFTTYAESGFQESNTAASVGQVRLASLGQTAAQASSQNKPEKIDWRMIPLAVAAWVGSAIGVLFPDYGLAIWALIGIGTVGSLAASMRKRWIVVGIGSTLAASCILGWVQANHFAQSSAASEIGRVRTATFKLVSDTKLWDDKPGQPPYATVSANLVSFGNSQRQQPSQVPIKVVASGEVASQLAQLPFGATVSAKMKFVRPDRGEAVSVVGSLRGEIVTVNLPNRFDQAINTFRSRLRGAMAAAPGDSAGLVPSLVVGDTSNLRQEITESFRETGLSHLTAVSGTNLTLLLVFMSTVAKGLGVKGWWIRILQCMGVGLFVVVCRGEPSVLRAGAMGLVNLAAFGQTVDQRKGLRNLSVAVWILLLVNPWLAVSWGFALSVTASAGILWWGTNWKKRLDGHWPVWLAEAVCIPLAAQIATTALVVGLSSQISVAGLAANAAAGPFIGPVTVVGLAAGLASLAWDAVATGLGAIAGWLVMPVIWLARFGASLEGATIDVSPGPVVLLSVVVASLLAAALVPEILVRGWLAGLCAGLLIVAMVWRPILPDIRGWQVVFCDVGQGDMTMLRVADRQAVVVDVGTEPEKASRCLKKYGVNAVPVLVLTHFHLDHVGGLSGVLDSAMVGQVKVSQLHEPAANFQQVSQLLDGKAIRVSDAVAGESWTAGEVTWQTLSISNLSENDSSVVALAQVSQTSVLLPGDVEPAGQREALRAGANLSVDILKVPHHGSAQQEQHFLEASDAEVAVFSAGEGNEFGHPSAKTIERTERLGMVTRRTDLEGDIVIRPRS